MSAGHPEFILRYLRKSTAVAESFDSELAALARGAALLHHGAVSGLAVFNGTGHLVHDEDAIRRVAALLRKGHEALVHHHPPRKAHAA